MGGLIKLNGIMSWNRYDKAIHKVHLESNEIIAKKKKAHSRMFACVGVINNMLVTACHPMNELCFWDVDSLEMIHSIELDLKLSGRTAIDDNRILIGSRSINGLYEVLLEGLIHN